jgi:hypothetical protein
MDSPFRKRFTFRFDILVDIELFVVDEMRFGTRSSPMTSIIQSLTQTLRNGVPTCELSLPKLSLENAPRLSVKPMDRQPLNRKLRKVAIDHRLSRVEPQYITQEDLDIIKSAVLAHSMKTKDGHFLSFAGYQRVQVALPKRMHWLCSTTNFALFPKDSTLCINAERFMDFVRRSMYVMDALFTMVNYARTSEEFITEDEMQEYIEDMIPQLELPKMNPTATKFYVCHALRKFTFFHDKMRQGKMSIEKVAFSSTMAEFLELRESHLLPKEALNSNWFSPQMFSQYYSEFMRMDANKNGTLSRKELTTFREGNLTRTFLDRVFQSVQLYNSEIVKQIHIGLFGVFGPCDSLGVSGYS